MADPSRPPTLRPPPTPPTPLTLDDLLADLVWPRLLRAARLAFRPARIGLAAFHLAGCAVLLRLADVLDRDPARHILWQTGVRAWNDLRSILAAPLAFLGGPARAGAARGEGGAAARLHDLFIDAPLDALREAPLAVLIVFPLLLTWTVLLGAAIARTAATELGASRTTPWPEALGLALRRWSSLVGAAVAPLLLIWLTTLGLAVAGWVLFSLPVVSIVGGLLWGLFLLAGVVVAMLALGYLAGHILLTPGVVCEGSDTIDAVQHAYAMVFSRPLRLLVYALILLLAGLALGAVVHLVIHFAEATAAGAAGAFTGERGDAVIGAGQAVPLDATTSPTSPATAARRADPTASGFIRGWSTIFELLGAAVAVSYFWCAAAALFLAMRRVCDGQDFSEIWSPGTVPGEGMPFEPVRAADQAPVPAASPSRGEAVEDNGPADEG